ncbi:cyclic beta 1-2 glucan synthetase [Oxalobacter aliiformigenes]|uniref:Cyclic beta 1-2 glucan synthetase n=1 Tax=Oxalobacter aliiformigenes TaxID=2946593 RepID=A0A9E9NT01_9BURK|nr:glucoamylase family protein [Oxalobacter aliiformigenes]WAV90960.1 cyclic beta 1-2 glucan synthetase [Oxalobacter aliiformigenes]
MKTISELFNLFRQPLFFFHNQQGSAAKSVFDMEEEPLRSELYSITQMGQYGKYLARTHVLSDKAGKDRLLARLTDNESVIRKVYDILASAVRNENRITPAAEWLLDNFYLIEEQVQTAKNHLPEHYSSELPRLANGPMAGMPRVYALALEVVSHGDGHIDANSLSHFISSYQEESVLTLGELWAIPIMLRLALIENLRRVSVRLALSRTHHELAEVWVQKFIDTAENDPGNLILQVADLARSNPPMVSAFVAELTRRLQSQKAILALPLTWISQRLSETGMTIEQLVMLETQRQAADQVSISNSIGSIRLLSATDWHEFVESLSEVEQILRTDPAQVYSKMDFTSRDHYRHEIEKIAKKSPCTEVEVAQHAINLTRKSFADPLSSRRTRHVGYYLIDKGRSELEKKAEMKKTRLEKWTKSGFFSPFALYLGSISIPALILSGLMVFGTGIENLPVWLGLMTGLCALIVSSQLAVAVANWFSAFPCATNPLPKMDFSKGIPEGYDTLVVVPSMLISVEQVENLCGTLEVHYLANRDKRLRFCLLTDLTDAETETTPDDIVLINHLTHLINELNGKHASDNTGPFLALSRPRHWNPGIGKWIGYERKRGKLEELNRYLKGCDENDFTTRIGNIENLEKTRYVITLDSDTRLLRDSARQFVGTMAHPLNAPKFDAMKDRITEGYGILQPRITNSLPAGNASWYEKLCSGDAGIDPYTRAVSDIYQDIFGEGSFIGKGIYDVDAVYATLNGRLPENSILSHDLLEGCYARSGLLSDGQLYEQYPSSYLADVKRRHRWIRGDWQLLKWLFAFVPDVRPENRTGKQRNPLSWLSRWKLFDNLRRSLFAPATVFLFFASITVFANARIWIVFILAIFFLPPILASLTDLIRKQPDISLKQHFSTVSHSISRHFLNALLSLVLIPHEACYSTDAISRTLWRILFSKRHLLEWIPSAMTDRKDSGIGDYFRNMWFAPAYALMLALTVSTIRPDLFVFACPFIFAWLLSPVIAWKISQPSITETRELSNRQKLFLRKLSRKIWSFFDAYIGAEDNWLPPDNIQQMPRFSSLNEKLPLDNSVSKAPEIVVAHRTSPTNIGLALLSCLAANDFGYIPSSQLISRLNKTFGSMNRLERYRGHFYNWYDTQTLQPLQNPVYISSVDSGNLAGHLITLKSGLSEQKNHPALTDRLAEGLRDTFELLKEEGSAHYPVQMAELDKKLDEYEKLAAPTLLSRYDLLESLTQALAHLVSIAAKDTRTHTSFWSNALLSQCKQHLDEMASLTPWILLQDWDSDPDFAEALNISMTLQQLSELPERLFPVLEKKKKAADAQKTELLNQLDSRIRMASHEALKRIDAFNALIRQADDFSQMDFSFLYDKSTHLLSIGYNITDRRIDNSYYDLLASEARLTSFVAIALGQIPQENWFALGRMMTVVGGDPILLSWSGSMFEYLMPHLVMPGFENTLLDQTHKAAVRQQRNYGRKRGVPWGISESGYYAFDARLNYQYRAFGVPGLGLKRGLADDLVIAPYATMLAMMVEPEISCENLMELHEKGFNGQYGLFEAIDYTQARLTRGQNYAIVQSYMAHHQGMGFLALESYLLDQPMQKRFAADPWFQATLPLLHERIPKTVAYYERTPNLSKTQMASIPAEMPTRIYTSPDTRIPEVQLLSNGSYHVMVTQSGGGYSRWKDYAMTRWKPDTTRDNWGTFFYLRDIENGDFWSTAYQPVKRAEGKYETVFSEGRAEYKSVVNGIETHCEVVVSPEDDIELRRHKITNRSGKSRTVELTSYSETVLALPVADLSHPAFSKLFVQTEIIPEFHSVISTRRPRFTKEKPPYAFSMMVIHDHENPDMSYETDRLRFLGRMNTPDAPEALTSLTPLSGSQGSVLDPVSVIRCRLVLQPEESVVIDYVAGMTPDREQCLRLMDKYDDRYLADRVFEMAWTHNQAFLHQLNADESDSQLYARLAGSIIYPNPAYRAESAVLSRNSRGQSGLWSYAISGDLPIVLIQIHAQENLDLVRQILQAHAYWHMKGLKVDLVIWNEDFAGYRQVLQEQIMGLISSTHLANQLNEPGGIFVRLAEQISPEDRILISSVARIIISDMDGPLALQIKRSERKERRKLLPLHTTRPYVPLPEATRPVFNNKLLNNGIGGYSENGEEYIIHLPEKVSTPAPWVNVLANATFGTIVSESGQSYTWDTNAHEFRLTPWENDPVSDQGGETFYLRDEETGHYWSPTPLPCRGQGDYLCRHGFGYSIFEHTEDGIHSELQIYVALDNNIKYSVLKIRNDSGTSRSLSATGYVEWVMGELREKTQMSIVTEIDPVSGALFARNPYNTEFADRIAFFTVNTPNRTVTGNRTEFIGRNNSLKNPAAMSRTHLSNRVGAGYDPCGAIHVPFTLANGQEKEIRFMLGTAGRRSADASQYIHRYRSAEASELVLHQVRRYWEKTLSAVRVKTPDTSLDMLANGWLMYQTIACRLWARSGYYQSGGAFGFRDQLQDAMAVVHTEPQLLRNQILLCCEHQFVEGDVQHWWHPPGGRGVRTRCSDDYLWLPLAVCRYVTTTGDTGLLDENRHFIEGRPVPEGEESYYDLPRHSQETGTVYEHCVRSIRHGLRFGTHGLPLMGSGDWNDGMDKVGIEGKGESVWLAFFLYTVLDEFAVIAADRNDISLAENCRQQAKVLQLHIEQNAWDGKWYRRAYFDNGMPLGSQTNTECTTDSISQSWSVLSGAGETTRTVQAMQTLNERLVRRDDMLIQLLDPPFDKSDLNPGYIKGYVPGVRENGGQYTHAAIWAAMAFAKMGHSGLAWELFRLINPVNHSLTPETRDVYKVEPYVVAADVYAVSPHTGRGGWSWYTGSSGWMYRLIVESLLGIRLEKGHLDFVPCLPPDWTSVEILYRYKATSYKIIIEQQPAGTGTEVLLDNVVQPEARIPLEDDMKEHHVLVRTVPKK